MKKLFTVFSALVICISLGACSGKKQLQEISESGMIDTYELVEPEEHGTSEYVDYLSLKAKSDDLNSSDDDLQYALSWIKFKVISGDLFSSQEVMERAIYNGELLDWHYSNFEGDQKIYAKIGWQTFKTVKYVYRGIDDIYDNDTVDNLKELTDLLESAEDIVWRR